MRLIRQAVYDKLPIPFEEVERTPGLHLSSIIKVYRELQEKKKPQVASNWITVQLGYVWERVLEKGMKDLAGIRPGTIEYENILMSPDGLVEVAIETGSNPLLDTVYNAVAEHKFTFSTSRRGILEHEYWMMQVQSYALALHVHHALMNVLYLLGDYSRPYKPIFISYLLEFTDFDLQQNWGLIKSLSKNIGGEKR